MCKFLYILLLPKFYIRLKKAKGTGKEIEDFEIVVGTVDAYAISDFVNKTLCM